MFRKILINLGLYYDIKNMVLLLQINVIVVFFTTNKYIISNKLLHLKQTMCDKNRLYNLIHKII